MISFVFWLKWEQENLLSRLTDLYQCICGTLNRINIHSTVHGKKARGKKMIYIIRSLSGSKQGYSVTWQAFFYTFVLDGLDGDVWPNWSGRGNEIQVVGFPVTMRTLELVQPFFTSFEFELRFFLFFLLVMYLEFRIQE